ncbi:GNAT family N-acetyltransferase [Erwinia piriflorinigrans]|uniref:N-acetyltransferase domain-containing protein n=1 Tax=Erwinia piriflorinigrans CFBP 5888 TaxID=1161919 RepID=V5Z4E1_9GAMM|nr:GNAT family N-acetyltransferase [Erwinia piriflorinigrans]CCG86191.1 hypothetical protein EPIR_0826 [Erwinia piriflorinigrans CFBP 5888]
MKSHVSGKTWHTKRSLHFARQKMPPDISIEPVSTLHDFCCAMRKLHTEYVRLGILKRQQGDMLFSPWLLHQGSRLLVAKKGDEVVGSISLIPQAGLGMPAEAVFGDAIRQQGSAPQRTAEIGSLCIDERYRGTGLLRGLYATAILYAAFWQNIDTIFIQIDSRKARFYREMLFFKSVVSSRPHPGYQNLSAALMRVDIKSALVQIRSSLDSQRRMTLKQVMASLHIDNLYQQLHVSLARKQRFHWNTRCVHDYCQRCGVDTERCDERLRQVLQQSWG